MKSTEGGEPLAAWQIPNTKLTIARITEGPQRGEYQFSSGTVEKAVELYEEVKKQPYRSGGPAVSAGLHDWYMSTPGDPSVAVWVDSLPEVFRTRPFGLAIWQWLGLLLGATASIALMLLAYRIGGIRDEAIRDKEFGSLLGKPAVSDRRHAGAVGVQARRLAIPNASRNLAVCHRVYRQRHFSDCVDRCDLGSWQPLGRFGGRVSQDAVS